MEKKSWKMWIKYAVTIAVGLAISIPVAIYRGAAWNVAAYLNARYFSDGFFVAAVLLVGIGAMTWISTTGFFDIFGFGFRSLLVLFTPLGGNKNHMKYYDYKAAKAEKRGKTQYFILFVGCAFVLLSLVCLYLYYHLPA